MLFVVVVFIFLLLLNMPIAFTIGIAGSMFFLTEPNLPISLAVQRLVTGTQAFPLLAVPFFVLAGHIMNASGITSRVLNFASALTGHLLGSIAHISIVLSMLMGGVSGSSNADVGMQTRILMPKMRDKGYSDGFSTCVLAYSSLVVAIIPPSIGLILFGFVGQVSIGKLFLAGIIPGILMSISMMITVFIIAKKRGYDADQRERRKTFKEVAISFKESFWALLFPVILVMTIRFGVFTPTEAGAFAVVYALFIGKFVYKELNLIKIREVFRDTVQDNAIILLIISMASILGYVLAYGLVPQSAAQLIVGVSNSPIIILSIILLFLLLVGMVMEGSVNILLLTPIFLPIVKSIGYDPIHFGILMSILIQIGGVTPPVGVNMYTVCSLANVPVEEFLKESLPFLLTFLVLLAILVAFPGIVLFLPNLLMK
ncbi:MAG: TRAP transporter large permease [Bacillota bacterium]